MSVISFAVVGNIHTRVFLSPILFLMISVGLAYEGNFEDAQGKAVRILLSIFLACSLLSLNCGAKASISDYNRQWEENVRIIEHEKAQGNLDVVLNPVHPTSRFCAAYGLDDLKPKDENDFWLNRGIAAYYHLHTIQSAHIAE